MALHSEGSYEDVLALMCDGLAWSEDAEPVVLPTKSAIFQARARLGPEPLAGLFSRTAVPLASPGTAGGFVAGRRLVAIDGTCLDVADSAVNDAFFGRPAVNKGEQAAFPQARVVAIAECASHAIFDAAAGPYTISENAMAGELIDRLELGMLLLADRGFAGIPLWSRAVATGADLLWRAKPTMKPRHVATLADGTWLAELRPADSLGRHAEPLTVRVIDYSIDDGRTNDTTYRLLTTLVDPEEAPAEQLAAAYAQRWEIESTFDELKTHQRGPRTVLRSRSPPLVLQEIWGHLCCHYAIRTLMWEAADRAGVDADRVSFVAALHIARRSIPAAREFPPHKALTTAGVTPSCCSAGDSTPPGGTEPTPASSNASTSSGTSNEPAITTGPNPPAHPSQPSSTLTERYWSSPSSHTLRV